MFKIKLAVFAAMTMALASGSASAQQATQAGVGAALPDGKIAVVDSQQFPAAILELRQKYEQLEKQFQDRYQRLQQVENQLKQMESDIRTQGPSLTADKLQEKQDAYERLKKQGTRDYEDLKGEYDRTVEAATKPVKDKLYQFLNNYATQHGIVLVINLAGAAQTGVLAYWNPGTDITSDFITEYNKANPVPGAAPPGQPVKPPVKPPGKP